jgi:hypothetical protein
MDALLGTDFAVAEKNRLYRRLDRVLEHKRELFLWLRGKWADLFRAEFEVLLYDLTSTYFEGAMEDNPKAKYDHSRDKQTDCLQVVIALVITTDGFPASPPRQQKRSPHLRLCGCDCAYAGSHVQEASGRILCTRLYGRRCCAKLMQRLQPELADEEKRKAYRCKF